MGSPHATEECARETTGHDDIRKTPTRPPAAPRPENDVGIVPSVKSPSVEDDDLTPEHVDVFTLKPVSALRLLCRSIDSIVQMTGDVPPTPPVSSPTSRRLSSSHPDRQHLASTSPARKDSINQLSAFSVSGQQYTHEHIDGVPFKKTPIGSPEAHLHEPNTPAHYDIGYNAPPVHVQYGALARRFYSKRPPPISTEEYLLRMHKYCPMSTAVYLATSIYITRLAVIDKIVPVTPRNVHRLLLAGLRVAMKALEDLSWPHGRFSKVGGVNEHELGRLEITFCFLMDFVLKVDAEMLQREAESLCRVVPSLSLDAAVLDSSDEGRRMELKIPEGRFKGASSGSGAASAANTGIQTPSRTPEKRKASSTLPSRPAFNVGSGGIEVVGQS